MASLSGCCLKRRYDIMKPLNHYRLFLEIGMKNILDDRDECTGCSACAQICVRECITMAPDDEGFLFPEIDPSGCNDCGLCRKACPVLAARSPDCKTRAEEEWARRQDRFPKGKPRVYSAWIRDDNVRIVSSSGGIFTALAEACLKEGGWVFGAGFDAEFAVRHQGISNSAELDGLRRSKYVQSDTGRTFTEVKRLLMEGKPVLFVGTGCQAAGLKSFLGKDYPGLLTVDLVCYGVPSPRVWQLYLEDMKRRYKGGISSVSFRSKTNGWKRYRMRIEFDNGRVYSVPAVDDAYFIGFGKGLFNRRSCSSCNFRHPCSFADITLADFWGIEKLPDSDVPDNKGVSQVIANTEKGCEALEKISEACCLRERQFEEAARLNPRLISSCPMPPARAGFFADLKAGMTFARMRRKYMNPVVYRAKRIIKTILGRS